ncbi:selenocysteine insertion sequence-binding protein 2 [Atheta coriaria]|uniref:selenocysteine insertion sequence-binding protein 2 n=1 Tax=Dalotia coriaria TaxID=877792 RepID=UPI0031F3B356
MEACSSTPEGPLSREEIKELRKIRNKLKRTIKRTQNAPKPQSATEKSSEIATKGHVAVVARDVFEQINNQSSITSFSSNKQRKRQQLAVNLVELQAQQSFHNSVLSAHAEHCKTSSKINAVPNKLDKTQPVITKGKHSEKPKGKKLTALKKAIVKAENIECQSEADIKEINYVDNVVTPHLECLTSDFMKKVVELQEKYYQKNSNKVAIKKRYIVGLHQLKKYIILKKIHLFVIATDVKLRYEDPLHLLIRDLTSLATENGICSVFALKRRQIGRITLKHLPVTCFGVLNIDGLNDEFKILVEEIAKCKKDFIDLQTERLDGEDNEVYNNLLGNIKSLLVH